ncbi:MAG: PD40 domain-containing protein [Anaerolineales bacterium]|nr:PD40 domain-containing protein [Anaerolineales bacterium]
METSDSGNITPAKKSYKLIVIIMGLAGLGLLAFICIGAGLLYFVFGGVQGSATAITETMTQLAEQPVLNQIAFVGNDGNLWLVAPDGQNLRSITADGKGYNFPTWAPDGRRLAFVGPNEKGETVLYVTPTGTSNPTILFDQPASAPFYLYWSPDSRSLTFLTQETEDLFMRQINPDTPGSDHVLGAGAPFYWVWAPNSAKLLLHVGGARSSTSEAHLSLLDNRVGAERVQLNLAPGLFQAPFWSADGQYFYYIAADDKQQEAIYRTEAATLKETLVTKLQGFAYLALAPDNQHLAYVQIEGDTHPPFGVAYMVDTDGAHPRRLLDNPVGSLYWSPDGSKLALLALARRDDGSTAKASGLAAPLPQEVVFRWLVYDMAADTFETLLSFTPTGDFLQTVPFFDQYHQSLTFWSPDSRYFVATRQESEENAAGSVWVLDTTGVEEPLKVGDGTLAVWSWK